MLFDLQRFAVIYNETMLGGIDFTGDETNVVGTADVHDAILTVGDNTIRIVDAAGSNLNISGGQSVTVDEGIDDLDDYNHIINSTASVEVNGTAGNDFIENFSRAVTINAGGGSTIERHERRRYDQKLQRQLDAPRARRTKR